MDTRLVQLGDIATIRTGLATSGRGAGAREGDWQLRLVSVGNIQADQLVLAGLQTVEVERNVKTERQLLTADDVLVTARSTLVKAALVPPLTEPTAADSTLLVVRASEEFPDLAPYLWWYLTSEVGRSRVEARMTGSTVLALSATSLAEIELPLPDLRTVRVIADLVLTSERAFSAAIEAAQVRRTLFRDGIVGDLLRAAT